MERKDRVRIYSFQTELIALTIFETVKVLLQLF